MRKRVFALLLCLSFLLPALAENDDLHFSPAYLAVYVGETLDLRAMLEGLGEDESCEFTLSDPSVADLDENGILTVTEEGVLRVDAVCGDRTAGLYIRTAGKLPARRALLLCECTYTDGRTRTGAVNSVQGIADALDALRFRTGTAFEATTRLDSAANELPGLIEAAFADVQKDDVSLVYISCHGEMRGSEACLILHDGSTVDMHELERMLRVIPGQVVVLLDCCHSGAFLESYSGTLYAQAAAACFRTSPFCSGKYLVLASCSGEEDSYRMSDTGKAAEAVMSTVFSRAVCEGIGWDLNYDRSVALRADADRDGIVTFTELFVYIRRRVNYHLSGTGVTQTVTAWPEIAMDALFARQSG